MIIVLGLLGLAVIWQRRQMRGRKAGELSPRGLFAVALARLELPFMDRIRLRHLAYTLQIPHPAALLISATLYREAVDRYCGTRSWLGSRAGAAPRLKAIADRLFAPARSASE